MANCGCSSSSSSDDCYGSSNVVRQALIPITSNDCSGSGSLTPETTPTWQTGGSANSCVTIPAVGATFNVPVQNAADFVVGQWVRGLALGRYPIVALNASTNLLTLRNSCSDGVTAITGNPTPGAQICNTFPIWTTGEDPCLDADAQCDLVRECLEGINEENPLCLPDIPVTTDAECVRMLGLSASCDAGDCPQPDDPNCLTKLQPLRFCKDTIIFDEGLVETEEDECYAPVVISEDGKLHKATQGTLFYSLRKNMGQRNFGPANAATLETLMNFQLDMGDYGVPDCAKAVVINFLYMIQWETDVASGPLYYSYARSAGQPVQSGDNIISYRIEIGALGGGDSAMSYPAPVIVFFANDTHIVYHEFNALPAMTGVDNFFSVLPMLQGYYA